MKLLKDYDCTIDYHLGKANVVVDALSRKTRVKATMTHLEMTPLTEMIALRRMNVDLGMLSDSTLLANLKIRPVLLDQIQEAQGRDMDAQELKKQAN